MSGQKEQPLRLPIEATGQTELPPWQQTFMGKTWKDMLKWNADSEMKKLHFALFRRGLVTIGTDETGRSQEQKAWLGTIFRGGRARRKSQLRQRGGAEA